jgi:hypothetical protein
MHQKDIDEGFNISMEHVLVLDVLIDGFLYEYKWFESYGSDTKLKLLSGGAYADSDG